MAGAQLSVTDLRRATRHPVDFPVIGEHRQRGEVQFRVVNISANGFMVAGENQLGRGERILIRLPVIGRIEAHVIWTAADRSGLQFERVIRPDLFEAMIAEMKPNARVRRRR